MTIETMEIPWYVGRWKILYGVSTDPMDTIMDIEEIDDGFVIGCTCSLTRKAIPIHSIVYMEQEAG